MGKFSERLSNILAEEKITQSELCNRTGLSSATISRLLQGHIPTSENTRSIIESVSLNEDTRLILFLAHLQDQAEATAPYGLSPEKYTIAPYSSKKNSFTPRSGLKEEFEILDADAVENEDTKKIIQGMAARILRYKASLLDAAGIKPHIPKGETELKDLPGIDHKGKIYKPTDDSMNKAMRSETKRKTKKSSRKI